MPTHSFIICLLIFRNLLIIHLEPWSIHRPSSRRDGVLQALIRMKAMKCYSKLISSESKFIYFFSNGIKGDYPAREQPAQYLRRIKKGLCFLMPNKLLANESGHHPERRIKGGIRKSTFLLKGQKLRVYITV